ncbi:MAG: hypothetical protein KF709_00825 [Gemmatimonadaceae bacterium]|nr:hypothetical protein [Gemmatimonadaceae bacterium]
MSASRQLRLALAAFALPLAACTETVGLEEDPGCVTRLINVNESIPSKLSELDCVDPSYGAYVDWYELRIFATQTIDILMESSDVDAYLELYDEDDQFITDDDDSLGGTDAWIRVKLSPGTYYIAATTFDEGELGRYVVTVEPPPDPSVRRR